MREDTALDRIYLPAATARASASRRTTCAAAPPSPELRALLAMEVAPGARAVRRGRAGGRARRQASVRTGIRFAAAVYLRVLDRVERIDFDVLGRPAGVRPWQLPGAALGALRR